LTLDTCALTSEESDNSILTDGTVPVTALVMLAGGLPGDTELDGNLRPPDAEFDGVVDQRCEFGLCLLPCNAGAPDPLQYLRWGHPGNLLWHAG
jgi:hypothetical protein